VLVSISILFHSEITGFGSKTDHLQRPLVIEIDPLYTPRTYNISSKELVLTELI